MYLTLHDWIILFHFPKFMSNIYSNKIIHKYFFIWFHVHHLYQRECFWFLLTKYLILAGNIKTFLLNKEVSYKLMVFSQLLNNIFKGLESFCITVLPFLTCLFFFMLSFKSTKWWHYLHICIKGNNKRKGVMSVKLWGLSSRKQNLALTR